MSKHKILIIDDEEKILESLRRELVFFSESNNLEVLTANSAAQGLTVLEKEQKDIALVISDQRMPGLSGSDLLFRIKRLYPDIITIILSAHTEIEELIRGIQAGIFSFILKPWNKNLLIAEIGKALELYKLKTAKKEYLDMIREELQKTMLNGRPCRIPGYGQYVQFFGSFRNYTKCG
jgi:sigma-B regulation protein RsbU (phosphoserine phosphatase)